MYELSAFYHVTQITTCIIEAVKQRRVLSVEETQQHPRHPNPLPPVIRHARTRPGDQAAADQLIVLRIFKPPFKRWTILDDEPVESDGGDDGETKYHDGSLFCPVGFASCG
mmetsp:Transcript_16424/g.39308  ORF Transcript_16424/g.39308 Transcript_16424/m.39308 type:complete len:111 (-) Transcript_16424:51-383(-)